MRLLHLNQDKRYNLAMTKLLSQLLPAFKNTIVAVDGSEITDLSEINDIPISNLVFDSREVSKNSLFSLPSFLK